MTDAMPICPLCPLCWKAERLRVPLVAVGENRYRHDEHARRAKACGVFEFRGGMPTQPKPEDLEAKAA